MQIIIRSFTFLGFGLLFSATVFAQQPDSLVKKNDHRNSVYAELGGNGLFGSVNYERVFALGMGNERIALRIGGFFIPTEKYKGNQEYIMAIPVEVSFFFGESFVKPEFGLGLTYYQEKDGYYSAGKSYKQVYPMIRLGVRMCFIKFPLLLRVGLVPFDLGSGWHPRYVPLPGISVGYSFGKI